MLDWLVYCPPKSKIRRIVDEILVPRCVALRPIQNCFWKVKSNLPLIIPISHLSFYSSTPFPSFFCSLLLLISLLYPFFLRFQVTVCFVSSVSCKIFHCWGEWGDILNWILYTRATFINLIFFSDPMYPFPSLRSLVTAA